MSEVIVFAKFPCTKSLGYLAVCNPRNIIHLSDMLLNESNLQGVTGRYSGGLYKIISVIDWAIAIVLFLTHDGIARAHHQ